MKKYSLIVLVFTVFFSLMSMTVSAETDAERLDRLEMEIEEIKALKPSTAENVWAKYNMRIYGRVKVDLNYDTAEFKYNDFVAAVKEDASNDSVNFNPRDTRFGFEANHTDGNWTGKGRFEIDFYGTNAGNNLIPRMRLGYVDLANNSSGTSLRVGQDWIPVAQQNPATIDFGVLSAAGNLWWRVPQVTLRQKLDNLEFLLSAMKHRRTDTEEEERMPWALARVAYNFGDGNLVALGGGYQSNEYGQTGKDIDRSLVALEIKLNLGHVLLKAEGFWGEALDKDFLRYEMGINDSDPNNPKEIEAIGGFISLTANATDDLTVSAGYGIDDPRNDDMKTMRGSLGDRQFTRNDIAFVNGWYKITKGVKVGAEVMYVNTERFNKTDEGMRYTLSTFYNF
ncbi:MAG: hypothetical protein HF982_11520 [Desulfobacteraceae bacterium]|nr:hypothetical protein [Desulfobacteraceae bacterium]MBC2720195.1 hypothetical protein [Desulfobacteraceae bacterium]